jgi:membrane protein required for colicin V production
MTWIDWAIVVVVLGSTVGGLAQGFLRTACSLIGLFLGLSIAAWDYRMVSPTLQMLIHSEEMSNIISFLLIAMLVMAACNVVGKMFAKTIEWMGLGCFDMIAGAVLGFVQGAAIITLVLMGVVAFFPKTDWLAHSKLTPMFFGACALTTHMTPTELADKVTEGIRTLEVETKALLNQKNGVS